MNSVFPAKDKTKLPPKIMSQNVSTVHKCFKTAAMEQKKNPYKAGDCCLLMPK